MIVSSKSTTGMKSGGYYNANSAPQLRLIEAALPTILEAAESTPLPKGGRPYVIADYGCSEGANSIRLTTKIVEHLLSWDDELQVQVVHNDLPTNDFNTLLRNLNTFKERTYLNFNTPRPRVFPVVSGRSFYQQVLPSQSVHMAVSFSAAHWLSQVPAVHMPDHIYAIDAGNEARRALAQQASIDWAAFLRARAAELVPGGHLVMQVLGVVKESDGISEARANTARIGELLNLGLRELVAQGKVDRQAYAAYTYPIYSRTVAEVTEPLKYKDSPLYGAFDIVDVKMRAIPLPMFERFEQDKNLDKLADDYIGFIRAFSESSFFPGILRSKEDAELLFAQVKKRFASDLARYEYSIPALYIHLKKN